MAIISFGMWAQDDPWWWWCVCGGLVRILQVATPRQMWTLQKGIGIAKAAAPLPRPSRRDHQRIMHYTMHCQK